MSGSGSTLWIERSSKSDGLFSHMRNPNYLGEILIYSAYTVPSWHLASVPRFNRLGVRIFRA